MAQRAGARVLVVGLQAGLRQHFAHGADNLVRAFIVKDAVAHGKHAMASGGINAGIQPAAPVGEGGKHLGAIVPRVFHADDGQRVRKKLHKRGLLAFDVFAIGDGQFDAAAAAAFREGTFH